MDLKEIRQIIEMMKRSELTRFEIEESGFKLKICRDLVQKASAISQSWPPMYPPQLQGGYGNPNQALPAGGGEGAAAPAAEPAEDESQFDYITSPMVGSFYRAPSPDSTPYVEVGTEVTENSVVCIIEAMKVMNEIISEKEGRVVEILVENGDALEYGQKIFKIIPN